ETFGGELNRYLDRKRAALKPRSFIEVRRHLEHHCAPLHALRLGEINRREIAVRLAEIETASGPVARNRVRSSLSAFFRWALSEGLLEVNPVAATGIASEGGSRERVLSEAELRSIFRALDGERFADLFRLLILYRIPLIRTRAPIGAIRWT